MKNCLSTQLRRRMMPAPPWFRLDGTIPFRQACALSVPEDPGLYLIHDLRGILYVGRTRDLLRQFWDHYWAEGNPLLLAAAATALGDLNFSWQQVTYPRQIPYEQELIRAFAPLCHRTFYTESQQES
jgi:hypothetical protein